MSACRFLKNHFVSLLLCLVDLLPSPTLSLCVFAFVSAPVVWGSLILVHCLSAEEQRTKAGVVAFSGELPVWLFCSQLIGLTD